MGFSGPSGTFTVTGAPSDSNGAVGATQFVEMVNTSYAVFSKSTGAAILGPLDINTIWTGFGGQCEAQNDGDPVAAYEKAAKTCGTDHLTGIAGANRAVFKSPLRQNIQTQIPEGNIETVGHGFNLHHAFAKAPAPCQFSNQPTRNLAISRHKI